MERLLLWLYGVAIGLAERDLADNVAVIEDVEVTTGLGGEPSQGVTAEQADASDLAGQGGKIRFQAGERAATFVSTGTNEEHVSVTCASCDTGRFRVPLTLVCRLLKQPFMA